MIAENLDVDLYDTRDDAIMAALDDSEPGDVLTICRGVWSTCAPGGPCDFCARVTIRDGMRLSDVLAASTTARA